MITYTDKPMTIKEWTIENPGWIHMVPLKAGEDGKAPVVAITFQFPIAGAGQLLISAEDALKIAENIQGAVQIARLICDGD